MPTIRRLERIEQLERVPIKSGRWNRSSKAFTMIELLVSIFLLVMMLSIGLAAIVDVLKTQSKTTAYKGVQESGRTAMEAVSNQIRNVKMENHPDARAYGFEIGKYADESAVEAAGGLYIGPALRIWTSDNKLVYRLKKREGSDLKEILPDPTDPTNDGSKCPTNAICTLAVMTKDVNANPMPLIPDDVNVKSINFQGWQIESTKSWPPSSGDQMPFVTTEMTLESTYPAKTGTRETATLKSTISPQSFTTFLANLPILGNIEEKSLNEGSGTLACSNGFVAIGTGHHKSDQDREYPWIQCAKLINGPIIDYSDILEYKSPGGSGYDEKLSNNYSVIESGHWASAADNEKSYVKWAKIQNAIIDYTDTQLFQATEGSKELICPSNYVVVGDGHWASSVDNEWQQIKCAKIKHVPWSYQ